MFDRSSWFTCFMLGNLSFLLMAATAGFPRFRMVCKWSGLALYVLTTVLLFFVSHDPGAPWFLLLAATVAILSTDRIRQAAANMLKPITERLGDMVATMIVKTVEAGILLIAISLGLFCIYGLVRFVRWSWYH
jgi:Ca2+/H+ antiporter